MMKKQITVLILVAAFFILFDVSIYQVFTKRCINPPSRGIQAKSVELSEYLPFDEDSGIVKVDSATKLSGELPVMDGAAALYPVFSAFAHAVYPESSCHFDGTDFTEDSCLKMTNTRGAYKSVVDGDDDLVFCAKPSDEQLTYAAKQGVELELVPIGKEAFVFVVNQKNKVDNLTIEQVRGIYTGKYTNWEQLGGEHKAIAALQRNEGSGSQTAMLSFMDGQKIHKDRDTFRGSAIGFSFRYYVSDLRSSGSIKMLSLNGVEPSPKNIQNGKYPVVANFYAVYRKDNKNKNIAKMVEWILSDKGQEIVEKTGYVRM